MKLMPKEEDLVQGVDPSQGGVSKLICLQTFHTMQVLQSLQQEGRCSTLDQFQCLHQGALRSIRGVST